MDDKKNAQKMGHDKDQKRSEERGRSGDQSSHQMPGQQQPGNQQQGHQQHQEHQGRRDRNERKDWKEPDPKKENQGMHDDKPPENRMNRDK
jgi:hypothetical protein